MRTLMIACAMLFGWTSSAWAYGCGDIIRLRDSMPVKNYMQGVAEALLTSSAVSNRILGVRLFCIPGSLPFNADVATGMIVQYVHDHPDAADKNPAAVLQVYLIELFPCK